MTKTVARRIDKLENRLGIAAGKPKLLFVVTAAGWGHALDVDTCMDILRECGFVPSGPGIGLVDLLHLPDGLNAEELETFLREHGAELSGLGGVKRDRVISTNPTK